MTERLFTPQEIEKIVKEATHREKRYLDTTVIDGKATQISIFTISPIKKVIFTEGNEHTGYQHLRERHGHYVYKSYWTTAEDGIIRLDRPSKFRPDTTPIHYRKIVDAIFSPENKNITQNHRPDLFDKFTGLYAHENHPAEKVHLLTYKDTKIVHTMYPDKKRHNLKSVAKFAKGHVESKRVFPGDYADLIVPYEDQNGTIRYSILIRKFYQEQVERVFIQEHDENGEPEYLILLGEREINDFKSFDHPILSYFQHRDLIDYEKVINQLAEGTENIQIDPKTFRW
ncbi:hypothetical protein [Pedobacter sp. GR22-6]|uniref:hypothetical protein n=1 Tax=Pedobacter sp. GR22-6 TaxID=3127957 RepID=UPI00307D8C8B